MTHPVRRSFAEAYIAEHYQQSSIDVEVRFVPAADWYLHIDAPQGVYGWNFPQAVDNAVVLNVCPDVITHQTMPFGDRDFRNYLHAILWMSDRYYAVAFGGNSSDAIDPIAIQQQLESELYDLSPQTLAVFSRVQMSVLDH